MFEAEAEGLSPVPRRIEFLAVAPGDPHVVHHGTAARGGLGAVANGDVVDDEVGGWSGFGDADTGLARVVGHASTLGGRSPRQACLGRT